MASAQAAHAQQPPELLWREARRSIAAGVLVLLAAAAIFGVFVMTMPPLPEAELSILMQNFPPKSVPAIKLVRDTVLQYANTHPTRVAVALLMLYVIMQSFAMPGTAGLSLLAGALYGSIKGFALIAVISTLGSTSCYCLSWAFGRPIAHAIWKTKLDDFRQQVVKRQGDLLNYIIFLRVTPLLPNTFINVTSPIVGVPLAPFMLGTFIGCMPNNFMAANAGDHLSDLDSFSSLYSPRMLMLGLTVGLVALVPVYMKHRHERREQQLAAGSGEKPKAA